MMRKLCFLLVLAAAGLSMSAFSSHPAESPTQTGTPLGIWILVIVAFVAIGVMIWWWWRNTYQQGEERDVPASGHREPLATVQTTGQKEAEAEALAAKATTVPLEPDDLKRIEGIGPKIAAVLHEAGIQTFAQLAATDVERLKQILEARDPNLLRLADPGTWPEQASLAADGEWTALAKLQDELKGGKRA